MGREARTLVEVGSHAEVSKVLLESEELIVRGLLRRKVPLAEVRDAGAADGILRFHCRGETFALHLGEPDAARWLQAMLTPPPTLRDKLGLKGGAKAFLLGRARDERLNEAIGGSLIDDVAEAAMIVVVAEEVETLAAAVDLDSGPRLLPIWAVHGKGPSAPIGEAAVREFFRGRGYVDSKSCAVSDHFTATRYARRR